MIGQEFAKVLKPQVRLQAILLVPVRPSTPRW